MRRGCGGYGGVTVAVVVVAVIVVVAGYNKKYLL
jgi:hypothetical protein